jgi:VWFA-related protein
MVLRRFADRTSFGLLVLTTAVARSGAQGVAPGPDGQGRTIKSEVQLVMVDVVVTSGNGRLVGGLRREDFQVAEDGGSQTISFFEEHKGTTPAIIALPPMPPNVFTNYPTIKKTDSVKMFLLDALNTQNPDQAFVRGEMARYLQNGGGLAKRSAICDSHFGIASADGSRIYD